MELPTPFTFRSILEFIRLLDSAIQFQVEKSLRHFDGSLQMQCDFESQSNPNWSQVATKDFS